MASHTDHPELLTTAELAALLRKTPNAVHVMRYRGQAPPGFRCGRDVLYPRRGVEEWIAARLAMDPVAQRSAQ
ncbi:helix-turn-helix domain-containing protein [Streptomyces sp. NPDC057430]|uniref:helix-turn-helix domain-containing protein n=1 Tax=Streptomyces sp. NPDC057430 TaxID=3346131 RepID=UPI00369C453A